MNRRMISARRAFTLIELLVVVLILGILVAVALPAYLSSIKDAKAKTANANAKAIASAFQSLYVKGGGVSYASTSIPDTTVEQELNGWPQNPCSPSDTGKAGYTITQNATQFTIVPKAGECEAGSLSTITLGQP